MAFRDKSHHKCTKENKGKATGNGDRGTEGVHALPKGILIQIIKNTELANENTYADRSSVSSM